MVSVSESVMIGSLPDLLDSKVFENVVIGGIMVLPLALTRMSVSQTSDTTPVVLVWRRMQIREFLISLTCKTESSVDTLDRVVLEVIGTRAIERVSLAHAGGLLIGVSDVSAGLRENVDMHIMS